jgi:tetratricopeptide (TPR) repeat protein
MHRLSLFVVSLFLLLSVSPAWAETAAAPVVPVRAGVHAAYDRVVFDWKQAVKYTLHRDGNRATLKFSAPGTVHFEKTALAHLERAKDFSSAADKDGNLTVSFTINPKMALKDFVTGTSVVIDIADAPQPKEKPSAPVVEKASEITTEKNDTPIAASAAPAIPPAPSVVPPPAAPSSSSASTAAAQPVPVPQTAPVQTPAAAPPQATALAPAPATPTAPRVQVPFPEVGDTPLLAATFDPHTPMRGVVYQRAGYAYIVFDRKLTLTLAALTTGFLPPRVVLEPLDLAKATGFRFTLPSGLEVHAEHDNTAWQIYLGRQKPDIPVSTSLVAQPDFALGARFLLPLPDAPNPIHLTDPVVGDNLILVPLAQNEAFSVVRKMADFEIVPAAQGLVLKPLTDRIEVRSVTDGIEITADGGLRLSSAADTGASQQSAQKASAAAAGKSIFDFSAWRGKTSETFTQTRQRLQQTIVDVPEAERPRARLELARFYFAHGNGPEAVALLHYLAKQVPDILAHGDFMALLGASEILAYHPDDGLKDLDTPLLQNQPEIDLWKAVGDAELRNWTEAEQKFATTEPMLYGYPEPFHSRFSILAVESALAAGKEHEAADWLDRVEAMDHDSSIEPAIKYLHAVLYAKSGRAPAAEAAWKDVAASNDRLYRVRAELALIDLGVATGSLTPSQAADRLETMRFAWRGDDLEVDILRRLGQFYIQAKNIKAGMNAFAQVTQLYPLGPLVPEIKAEMAAVFHDAFLGNLGTGLSPLDALTLYQQYRSLMPTGADGDALMRSLAERLVQVDLLDQAASILEDMVKNRLQGEEKARVGARLAAIRLLDHKPDDALTALDYDKNDTLPADLQSDRQLLRAKALSELHKDDDALALLHDNTSEAAKLLRADITMHAQHWVDAARALLDLVGPPPPAGISLKNDQAEWLINCAIALSLAGDVAGLDKLANDYGPSMATTPQSSTFKLLTAADATPEPRDIAAAQARISDADMFQGYLNNFRKADTSAAPVDTKKP